MDVSPLLLLLLSLHLAWTTMDSCYDDDGTPTRCMPKFENIAFNRTVVASNVCGSPPEEYCTQTGSVQLYCRQCDASDPELSHNASLLTDFHRNDETTWWQSQSMLYGVQHPNSVNLTLHLGKIKQPELSTSSRFLSSVSLQLTVQDGGYLDQDCLCLQFIDSLFICSGTRNRTWVPVHADGFQLLNS